MIFFFRKIKYFFELGIISKTEYVGTYHTVEKWHLLSISFNIPIAISIY